jgi:regulator of cell morphogenesis and NO signaling
MVHHTESSYQFRSKQRLYSGKMDKFRYLVKKTDYMAHTGEFLITGDLRMADTIHINQRLLLVIERFGISLGFGDKSIAEVCAKHQLNTSFVLLVLNVFNDHSFSVNELLSKEYIPGLIDYLKNGHRYFLMDKLPYINELIDRFIEKTENPDSRLLRAFFKEYMNEVIEHMNLEERTVFPYILTLFGKIKGQKVNEELLRYQIDDFIDNHSNIEEKLDDLKHLLIKHFPPTKDRFYRNQILFELFDLEYDLNDHNGLEERILTPIVRTLEKEAKGNGQN